MKKFFILITACGLLAGSCAKSESAVGEEAGAVTFKVVAVNAIQTRSEIYSNSPEGSIPVFADVNVLAFRGNDSGEFLYAQQIDLTEFYETETNSAQQKLADGTITAGKYKFLAIGRTSLTDGYSLPELKEGVTNYNDITASITEASSETGVIFAGTTQQEVLASGANIEIEIARKVAGIFGYMSNVPVSILGTPVRYLRLRVSDANLAVNLGTGIGDATTATNATYTALEIDLLNQTIDDVNNVYKGAVPPTGVVVAENAQIVSNYAIPIDGITTMTLELQSEDGTALKTWSVQDSDQGTIDLKANVLMAIGVKNRADSEFGEDGVDDDTTTDVDETGTPDQDDTPASLLTDETIIVTLSKDWNEVQNLTLVEQ